LKNKFFSAQTNPNQDICALFSLAGPNKIIPIAGEIIKLIVEYEN